MMVWKIIEKNLKLLVRSKSSALIVIFGPLLVILLMGIAFDNTNTYGLNIGVYCDNYTEITLSFVDKLNDNDFNIEKFYLRDECVNAVTAGENHACVEFPSDFSLKNDAANEIVFHVDYSRANIVWMILDTLSTRLSARSKELSEDLIKILLEKLSQTRAEIFNKRPIIDVLRNSNAANLVNLDEIRQSTDSMSLSFDQGMFDMTNLNSFVTGNKDRVEGMKAYVSVRLKAAEDYMEDAKEFANSSSVTSRLTNALSNVREAENKVRETNDMTFTDTAVISASVASVQNNLNGIRQNIDSASLKKTQAIAKIDEAKAVLDTVSIKLNEISDSMVKIDSNIASLKVTNAENIINPITTKIIPVTPKTSHLNYFFPSLIVLVVMFISVLLATTLVMMEKHSPAYFRNFITPVSDVTFITATYLTSMILVVVQIILILLISLFFFSGEILPNILTLFLLLVLVTSLFTLIGMLIGYIFNSEETATLASVSAGTILLLFSNLLIPLESMPRYFFDVIKLNPFVISLNIFKKMLLFGQIVWSDISLMLIYSVFLFGVVWAVQFFVKEKFFNNLHREKRIFLRFFKK